MSFEIADALVVSDIHAMSPDVDVTRFRQFVDLHPARMLVLAGDSLDFYMWRHGRHEIDTRPGLLLLDYLLELAKIGVEIVILPGNHDMDWEWMAEGADVPRRYQAALYPQGIHDRMKQLVAMENVSVTNVFNIGNAIIVHGHLGWQGDWLWRMSEFGDRATRYKMVGAQLRRTVMGRAPMSVRAAAVQGHGFYRRLASWGLKSGVVHIIHGHTHVHGQRRRGNVILDCLPAWRPSEGPGGGMLLKNGVWHSLLAE